MGLGGLERAPCNTGQRCMCNKKTTRECGGRASARTDRRGDKPVTTRKDGFT